MLLQRFNTMILIASLAVCTAIKADPIPKRQWTSEAKLWTARSCVGEAGFGAVQECIGIAWVYATRAKHYGSPYVVLVKKYSSAVKAHEKHRRGWIFDLQLNGTKPKKWPKHLSWKNHKPLWFRILKTLDLWAQGLVPNPVPGANHFGGKMDTPGIRWIRIQPISDVVFRNRFYRSKSTRSLPANSALISNSLMNGNR